MKTIKCTKAPVAIGPYSHAVQVGKFFFTSGQIPVDPVTGEVRPSIEEQTEQVLENLKAVLESEGYSLNNVVKTTVFITNMDDFGKINEVYSQYFTEHKPARSCVQVAKLPKGVAIEIEVIASKK